MPKKSSRRKFTAEFKSKVALEALKERMTLSELSKRHELNPNLVMQWKKTLSEEAVRVFQETYHQVKDDRDELIETLYREVGHLTMEVNILKKKLNTCL